MLPAVGRPEQSLFLVHSGIVAWEAPRPIADWKWKTVSVVSKELSTAAPLLWEIMASRPSQLKHVLRLSLHPFPASMTASQKRRIATKLNKDPPGFASTRTTMADEQACSISVLNEPAAVDPETLTAYRRCAIVAVESCSMAAVRRICSTTIDLDGSSIHTLIDQLGTAALSRVLDLPTCAVVQLFGSSETSDLAVQCLIANGVKRLHDMRTLPQELLALRTD